MNNPPSSTPENPAEAASPPDQTAEEYERTLLQFDEKHLWPMLLCIQQRLGTPQEQPADLDQVRAIAHRLSNSLTAIRLRTEIALTKRGAGNTWPAPCAGQSCGI
ncbi:MAG TPA: hypothetical protein VGD97_10650 [Lacunisphaera sp.]